MSSVDGPRIRIRQRETLSAQWARLESITFDYQRSDGAWQLQTREIYHRGHGAAILLYHLASRRVVLIRQFRFPAFDESGEGFLLEVPAGIVENGDPEATISAETRQETGFTIGTPVFLFSAYVSPGSVTERLHYFVAPYDPARRIDAGGGLAEEGEDIEVLEMDFDDALAATGDGRIVDAKTIILLQYAALNLF